MIRELENIPGVWTAVFHWFSCLLYVSLLPRKRPAWQCWIFGAVLLAAMTACMIAVEPLDGEDYIWGATLFNGMTMLPFFLLCGGNGWSRLYYGCRAFILGGFAVSFAWQYYTHYRQKIALLEQVPVRVAFVALLGGAVFALMLFLERRHRREIQEMPISIRSAILVFAISYVTYRLNGLSYVTQDLPFTTAVEADAFALRTIIYLGGLAILFAYHLELCDTFALQEVNALQNILDIQYASYRQSQESIDMVNQKYHDLKHQINLLRSEIGGDQKAACLDQIEREIQTYESQNQTGNRVLDAILTQKSVYCLRHGITLTTMADGTALGFLEVMDLSALFGNALDNAIEAVERIPDPEQRLIRLVVEQWKGFLRIRVSNRCGERVVLSEGLPHTTKEDRTRHGYGLKSIQATAEKYGGTMRVQTKDGWFALGILIPQPPGEAEKQKKT